MVVFIDLGLAYSPVNSAKLICSNEVTQYTGYYKSKPSTAKWYNYEVVRK